MALRRYLLVFVSTLALAINMASSFVAVSSLLPRKSLVRQYSCIYLAAASNQVDFQSDGSLYGRGERHLSASLSEGDIVVYQTGTWLVDGVQVGNGSPPRFEYALVETIQLVWTHNCEHGVVRGLAIQVVDEENLGVEQQPQTFSLLQPYEHVEFGPEQLIARIPVDWNVEAERGQSLVPFDNSLWHSHAAVVE
jgi:hypothetical protein